MIQGYFGEVDELLFEISLIAADGLELAVDAMLDTGFSGWLAINSQDVDALNWIFVQSEPMKTAQGQSFFEIYVGQVKIADRTFDVPVHVGKNLPEILMGRQWLKNRCLIADMANSRLTLD